MNKSVRTIWKKSQEGIVESRKGKVDMTEKRVNREWLKEERIKVKENTNKHKLSRMTRRYKKKDIGDRKTIK